MEIENSFITKYFFDLYSDWCVDSEAKDYLGSHFKIKSIPITYRKAKVTPKKIGCFVALWKRDGFGKTIPYDVSDSFDYYFIEIEDENKHGIFIFPKAVLVQYKILSSEKEGKRGFRLYPNWCTNLNTTAQKTQNWQLPYFVDLNQSKSDLFIQLKNIIQL